MAVALEDVAEVAQSSTTARQLSHHHPLSDNASLLRGLFVAGSTRRRWRSRNGFYGPRDSS